MKKLLTSLFAFTLICGGGIALSACGQQEPLECEFKVAQIGEEQKINVTWDCEENLSQIKILVTHENTVVSKYTVKGEDNYGINRWSEQQYEQQYRQHQSPWIRWSGQRSGQGYSD